MIGSEDRGITPRMIVLFGPRHGSMAFSHVANVLSFKPSTKMDERDVIEEDTGNKKATKCHLRLMLARFELGSAPAFLGDWYPFRS